MGLIGHLSISGRPTIAHIKKSEAKFRDMIKIEMGIGSDDGMAARVQVAKASSSVPTDLSEYKDKEYYVPEGANGKAICTFFQRKACTRKNCMFAHACWRCHKTGHGIIDCSMPPRLK